MSTGQTIGLGAIAGFTIFLGAAELAGALGVMFGVLIQLAAAGLILLMLGAIQKKMFVWKTGFSGQEWPGLALRFDFCRDEHRDYFYEWREVGVVEVRGADHGNL